MEEVWAGKAGNPSDAKAVPEEVATTGRGIHAPGGRWPAEEELGPSSPRVSCAACLPQVCRLGAQEGFAGRMGGHSV